MAYLGLCSQHVLPTLVADASMAALHQYSIRFAVEADTALLLRDTDALADVDLLLICECT